MVQSKTLAQRDPFARYTADLLTALCAPGLICVLSYGWTAVRLLLVCAITALLCEAGSRTATREKKEKTALNALLSGLTIAMMLPAEFSLWRAAVGVAFAVGVASFPFGGPRHTPFSPPAAGFVFLCLCFPKEVFTFSQPTQFLEAGLSPAASSSLASMLKLGESVTPNLLTYLNILIGNVPAAMGTACMAVLAGASLYLLIRRTDAWITSASFVTVCAMAAVLFPRVLTGRKASLFMEISAGSLVFAALFVLPHFSCAPKTPGKRVLFGGLAGLLCMLLSWFGDFESSACTAILLMNCLWPALDGTCSKKLKSKKREVAAHAQP